MTEGAAANSRPTLVGWLLRDVALTTSIGMSLWGAHLWQESTGAWFPVAFAAVLGFIGAYVLCYIYHEWGHLIGATARGAHMPLSSYRGALIGLFDVRKHTREQFLWLSWGGVIAYVLVALAAVAIHFSGELGAAGAGFAIGGLAFLVQSLSVDGPQIWRVHRSADPATTNAAGTRPALILKRTWQSWSVLAVCLVLWNLAG